MEHISQQGARPRAVAEQYPEWNARERMAIAQTIQWDGAARRGPAAPPTRPQGRDEEQAEEKQAMSQTDWDGHGYG